MREPEDIEPTPPAIGILRSHARAQRGIVIALLVSLALHGLFVLGLTLAVHLKIPFAIQFTESAGVGMMSRVGRVIEGSNLQTAPRYTRVDVTLPPAPLGPSAPTAEEREIMQAAQEAAEAEAAAQAAEEARIQAEAQAQAEAEAAAQRAAARQRRRERERLRAAQEAAEAEAAAQAAAEAEAAAQAAEEAEAAANPDDATAEASPDGAPDGQAGGVGSEGTPDAGPNMDLPPGERYPTGTINPIATDLGMWGPEGARLVVVTRNDRLRSSPHADSVKNLLQSFPDWRSLVGSGELDPLNDVDTMVVASSNPKLINRTFFAAIHHLPNERVIQTIAQGDHGGVTWENDDGRLIGRPASLSARDPRIFYVPTQQIFVFTRPEYMDALRGRAPTPRGMEGVLELSSLSPEELQEKLAADAIEAKKVRPLKPDDEPPLRDQGWIRGLMQIADYGGTERDGPALMISTGKIDDMRIQGYRGTMPLGLHANVFATADVRITARALFQSKAEAEAFLRAWPSIIEANRSSLTLTGLYRAMSDAKLSVDHNETIIELEIGQAVIRRLGITVSQLMQTR